MKLLRILFITFALAFAQPAMSADTVNINKATAAELQQIKGIGPKKAKAIVDYRKKHGKFNSVGDLMNVDGIGEKTAKSIAKQVSTSGGTKLSSSTKSDSKKSSSKSSRLDSKKEKSKPKNSTEIKKTEKKKDKKKSDKKKTDKKKSEKKKDKK